jgi:hypothetical protein
MTERSKVVRSIGTVTAVVVLLTAIIKLNAALEENPGTSDGDSSVSPPPQGTENTSGTPTAVVPARVYFHGHLEFGRLNLDLNPPKRTGDTYISGGTGGVFEGYDGAGKLAVWTSSGTPDRAACETTVDEHGAEYITGAEKGNHVCGRTGEGRIFRIDVTAVSEELDGGVTGDVTVWKK